MDIFDNNKRRLDKVNSGQRERRINLARYAMARKFEADPSFFKLNALEPNGIDTSTKRIKVINADYVTHLNPNRIHSRYFVGHPEEEVLTGTILFNLYKNDWMVTSSANLTNILERGMIQRINYIAKWYSGRILHENFAIISGVSRRSDGVEETRFINLPEDSIMLTIPKNNTTLTLKRDMRLMAYDAVYKISKIDRYTEPDLLLCILKEDEFKPSDDKTNEVCDVPSDLTVEIYGKSLVSYGSFAEYEINTTEEVSVEWTVEEGIEFLTASGVNSENGLIFEIMIKRDSSFIGKQIKLQAVVGEETYEKVITISTLS